MQGPADRGVPGLINLFGIELGLTACWRWPSRCATSPRHDLARRGLFAGLAGLLGGCSPATLLNATVSRQGFTREADIAYGTDPRQKLDLYRPDDACRRQGR